MGWRVLIGAWIGLTLCAIGVARGVIRPFFLEAFQIPSGAMLPTLQIGDHIMVDKRRQSPHRGDVVVFKYPLDPTTDYVKRVVGLPGDTIEDVGGTLRITGVPLAREHLQESCSNVPTGLPGHEHEGSCAVWNEIVDGHTYEIMTELPLLTRHDFPLTRVPEGAVFVLGDNRDNSSDSRVWGAVPLENIKGTVRFVWWSSQPRDASPSGSSVRWDRVNLPVR